MSYQGSDRRRHRVYRTRNTEYHMRDGVCVAVRDLQSKRFRTAHLALNLKVEGGVKFYSNGAAIPTLKEPELGDAIYFSDFNACGEERQIVTSRVEAIVRPSKGEVMSYP
jgi:hypothetical protein